MTDGLRQLYEEVILDPNRRPRHYGGIPPGAHRAISTASTSLMTECLIGRSEREAQALFRSMHAWLASEGPGGRARQARCARRRARVTRARVKCATLAWHTLRSALENESQTVTTE